MSRYIILIVAMSVSLGGAVWGGPTADDGKGSTKGCVVVTIPAGFFPPCFSVVAEGAKFDKDRQFLPGGDVRKEWTIELREGEYLAFRAWDWPKPDDALNTLSSVPRITSIDLRGSTGLTVRGLRYLGEYAELRCLELPGFMLRTQSNLLPEHLAVLSSLKQLTTLSISDFRLLTAESLPYLRVLENLVDLELGVDGAWCIPSDLAVLSDLPALRRLELENYTFGRGRRPLFRGPPVKWLDEVLKLKRLEELSVPSCLVKDSDLAVLKQLPNLRSLFFGVNEEFTTQWPARLPVLENLESLSAMTGVAPSAEALTQLQKFKKLREVRLKCSPKAKLTKEQVAALAGIPLLESVTLDVQVVPGAIGGFSAATRLMALTLLRAYGVTDGGIAALRQCKTLRRLDLRGARKLTGKSLKSIAHLEFLEYLRLDYANQILGSDLMVLTRCTRLRKIILWECKGISAADIEALKKKMPGLSSD